MLRLMPTSSALEPSDEIERAVRRLVTGSTEDDVSLLSSSRERKPSRSIEKKVVL